MNYQNILQEIIKIGKELLHPLKIEVQIKSDFNYVTAYDLMVEQKITTFLKENYPDILMWSEESNLPPNTDRYWLLDPIDGTTNFMHNLPLSAISLALIENHRPVFAVIHHPYLNDTYVAYEGQGAYLNDKRIQVSNRPLKESLVAFGTSPYNKLLFNDLIQRITNIFPEIPDIRRLGAASLDLVYLARGSFDAFLEKSLAPWDIAAGYLIVKEAGGILKTWDNQDINFKENTSVLAGTPSNFEHLFQIFNKK